MYISFVYRYTLLESSVMKSTVINSSKEMTAYSDLPPPTHFANYMHNRQMLHYLQLYADHHQLLKHVRFGHRVINVRRADDFDASGQWMVEYADRYTDSWDNISLI
jgi:dimethylaniline monooxygenase (N-oxide forming)